MASGASRYAILAVVCHGARQRWQDLEPAVDDEHRTAPDCDPSDSVGWRVPAKDDHGVAGCRSEPRADRRYDHSRRARQHKGNNDDDGRYPDCVTGRKAQTPSPRVDKWLQHILREHATEEGTGEAGNCATSISPYDKQSADEADHSDDDGVAHVRDRVERRRVEVHRDP